MYLASLSTHQFRNLRPASIRWSEGSNVILGANGHGKTNLLEAISILGNLRSFRSNSWRTVVTHQHDHFIVRGEVVRNDQHHSLVVRITIGSPVERGIWVDGRPAAVDSYLSLFPVFVLSSLDRELVVGPPAVRRAFIDRFAFHCAADMLNVLRSYRRSLRQRNAALIRRASDDELAAWEAQLARAAAQLVIRRHLAVCALGPALYEIYSQISGPGFPTLEIRSSVGGMQQAVCDPVALEEILRQRYNLTRARDRRAGHTLEGPHRHDVTLLADGRPVRDVLSSGQTKIVAAALRLATVASVEQTRGGRYPLIIDDVDAEIDRGVLGRIGAWLADHRQTFLSSADGRGLAAQVGAQRVVWLDRGQCVENAPAAGESV